MIPRQADADDPLPLDRQAIVLARALAYDGNLAKRAGNEVTVAVLYKSSNSASTKLSEDVEKAFRSLASIKILGLSLRAMRVPYTGVEALTKAVAAEGIDTFYVCPELDGDLEAIKTLSRKHSVLTIGNKQDQLKNGLSLGVFYLDGKSTIVVNVGASREEGVAFGSDLLRLARVIK